MRESKLHWLRDDITDALCCECDKPAVDDAAPARVLCNDLGDVGLDAGESIVLCAPCHADEATRLHHEARAVQS